MANLLPGARWMPPDDVRALFPDQWWHEGLDHFVARVERRVSEGSFDGWPHDASVQFIEGDLELESYAAGDGPWAVVVHGDLRATGDLDFSTTDYTSSLLVVMGTLTARNFQFTNSAICSIAHDLVATNLVCGRYGDENAQLGVGGVLRARTLILDHVTGCDAAMFDAIVYASEGWRLPRDIKGPDSEWFDPAVLNADGLDFYQLWDRATSGQPLLLPEAETELRAIVAARLASPLR